MVSSTELLVKSPQLLFGRIGVRVRMVIENGPSKNLPDTRRAVCLDMTATVLEMKRRKKQTQILYT
jgi:hypothetical protein